jgi:hypothetical protein
MHSSVSISIDGQTFTFIQPSREDAATIESTFKKHQFSDPAAVDATIQALILLIQSTLKTVTVGDKADYFPLKFIDDKRNYLELESVTELWKSLTTMTRSKLALTAYQIIRGVPFEITDYNGNPIPGVEIINGVGAMLH